MKIQALIIAAALALVAPASSFAYTGTLKIKGGCAVANTGSCKLSVTGTSGSVKIYAAPALDGHYGAVSNSFSAPGEKRIANSSNNKCFYARSTSSSARTRQVCIK